MATTGRGAALLEGPAALAVPRIGLALADDARDAAIVLLHAADDDPDAVHDFRVAVRRLRSWLRHWRAELGDAVPSGQRRRLREVAHATGPVRDLQVHLEWLRGERDAASRGRADIERAIASLVARRDEAEREVRVAARSFVARHAKLSRRLGDRCSDLDAMDGSSAFGVALADHVDSAAATLRQRLAEVRTAADEETLHRARIAAKRLRYLVECVDGVVDGAATIVRDLRQLQDLAGDAHDAHVFSRELRSDFREAGARGSGRLDRRLRERGARAYASLAPRWVGDSSAGFFRRTATLAKRLRAGAGG